LVEAELAVFLNGTLFMLSFFLVEFISFILEVEEQPLEVELAVIFNGMLNLLGLNAIY